MLGRPRDWFDFASAKKRIETSEIALLGSGVLDVSESMAPSASMDQHAREAERQWRGILYRTPCPYGDYNLYDQPVRSVADRLPIWC